MDWLTAIGVYIVIWWTTLFAILPLWVHKDENPQKGNDPGAPQHAHIGRKFLLNTAVAFVFFLIVLLIAESDLINFREMAKDTL